MGVGDLAPFFVCTPVNFCHLLYSTLGDSFESGNQDGPGRKEEVSLVASTKGGYYETA